MKNLPNRWGRDWEGKPKDHKCRYCRWKKPSNLDWRQGEKNRDWWRKGGFVWGGTWMIRDLVRIRYCVVFSEVKLPMVNYYAGFPTLLVPRRQISGYLPASSSRTTLTRIFLYCLFLVAPLSASISAFWCVF